jgi:hypothetical protein
VFTTGACSPGSASASDTAPCGPSPAAPALHEPEQDEQNGGGDPHLVVRRQHTDQGGGRSHDEQGEDEDAPASPPVAERAQDEAPEGAGETAHDYLVEFAYRTIRSR